MKTPFFIITSLGFALLLSIYLTNCYEPPKNTKNVVIIHEPIDPKSINPLIGSEIQKVFVGNHLYQSLLTLDYKTLELIPLLASSLPVKETGEDGKLYITYNIRNGARWDNDEPITAKDVAFSLKVIKNPKVDALRIRHMYDFIRDFVYNTNDPKSFTLVCENAYMLNEVTSGTFPVIPAYVYDKKNLMGQFTIKALTENPDTFDNNPAIIEFADTFNSDTYKMKISAGSGPYFVAYWKPDQRLILKKKQNWWGTPLVDTNHWFEAYPEKIIFEIISDLTTAIVALKAGEIDVMRDIPPNDFLNDLTVSDKFKNRYITLTPDKMSYEYIGLNTRIPLLKDKRVRQALSYLVDMDNIIKDVYYGLGERLVGYIHPVNKRYFNDEVQLYDFDIEKAKELFMKAGWKDSNANGILDKVIEDKVIEFEVSLMYRGSHEQRSKVALIFKDDARKAGVKINLLAIEYNGFIDKLKKRDFDMYLLGLSSTPVVNDPKQSWHTDYIDRGSNFTGFGNKYSDELIEKIRTEMDEEKRIIYYKEFQKILHDEAPCIFMNTTKERIAVNKRFSNVYGSPVRPGYWDCGFIIEDLQDN